MPYDMNSAAVESCVVIFVTKGEHLFRVGFNNDQIQAALLNKSVNELTASDPHHKCIAAIAANIEKRFDDFCFSVGNCSRARREHSFWRGFDVAELRCWKQWRGKIASEVG